MNLLNFHNALLHTKDLLEKPTLKHTLHVAALTAEGRIYENGQGRSIASECRHILVRKECDIPIKSRPDRKPTSGDRSGSHAKKKRKTYSSKSEYVTTYDMQPNSLKVDSDDVDHDSYIEDSNQFIAISNSRTTSLGKRHILREMSPADSVNASSMHNYSSRSGVSPVPLLRATSNEWPAHLGLSPRVLTVPIGDEKGVFVDDNVSPTNSPRVNNGSPRSNQSSIIMMRRGHSAEEWPKHLQEVEGKTTATKPGSPPQIVGLTQIFSPGDH